MIEPLTIGRGPCCDLYYHESTVKPGCGWRKIMRRPSHFTPAKGFERSKSES